VHVRHHGEEVTVRCNDPVTLPVPPLPAKPPEVRQPVGRAPVPRAPRKQQP
jgi:alpha,alpha-trehalose phosphorylase